MAPSTHSYWEAVGADVGHRDGAERQHGPASDGDYPARLFTSLRVLIDRHTSALGPGPWSRFKSRRGPLSGRVRDQ
jgi:hypothetical protein